MRILGYDITRADRSYRRPTGPIVPRGDRGLVGDVLPPETKAAPAVPVAENRGGWFPVIREHFTGAWQRNAPPIDRNLVLSFHAVYACITLIPSDIAKLRVKLVEQDDTGVWTETSSAAFSPVLRKPNHFQNRIQFWETWFLSKLQRGNTYVLKERDDRGVVVALYVLDPNRCKPMVADDGSVFYQLSSDNMAGGNLETDVMVPASEIIHDRMNCLFHPLVGTSPIFAAGLAAQQGLNIQIHAARLFENGAQPGGILAAPGKIDPANAERLKASWEQNFSGSNAGRVAILGDGLKYEKMALTAVEGQMLEQQKWSAEVVCSVFHVPPYKAGVGAMPTYNNIQSLNVEYYSQCLQVLIEAAELCLDEGLGIGIGTKTRKADNEAGSRTLGTEFDVANLLRMDSVTQMEVLDKGKSIMTPDEQRRQLDLKPTPGGNVVYRQQQDYSLAALAKRDARDDPFAKSGDGAPAAAPANDNQAELEEARAATAAANARAQQLEALIEMRKGFG